MSPIWSLDSDSDGCDETGLVGEREEVMADILHHHDLQRWPSHTL